MSLVEFLYSDAAKKVMDDVLSVHGFFDEGPDSKYRDITGNILQRLMIVPDSPELMQRKHDKYSDVVKPELLHKGVIAYLKNTKWENPEAETEITYDHEGSTRAVTTSLRAIDTNLKDYLSAKVLKAAMGGPAQGAAEERGGRAR